MKINLLTFASNDHIMRTARVFWLMALVFLSASCGTGHRLYFVRHAEKSTQPPRDPDLTDIGKQRAESLSRLLRSKDISSIYSTDTRRTRQTAEPLSRLQDIPVQLYSNDTAQRFLYQLLDREQSALVVGHSNTVISMLKELGLTPTLKEISDNDYDNLFIVIQRHRNGRAGYRLQLKERTYGRKSPPAGVEASGTMMMK
jgi:broad specificity phosphatase PhoE